MCQYEPWLSQFIFSSNCSSKYILNSSNEHPSISCVFLDFLVNCLLIEFLIRVRVLKHNLNKNGEAAEKAREQGRICQHRRRTQSFQARQACAGVQQRGRKAHVHEAEKERD